MSEYRITAQRMMIDYGHDRAIWHAQLQRQGATDQTKRAHWERVLEAIKAQLMEVAR